MKEAAMETYDFTFVVTGVDPHAADFDDRFFDAGCDDATIVLRHGVVAVCFARQAQSYRAAALSAYSDVLKTGASLLRFEPDYLVSASEIAARAGLSRQAVSNYERGSRAENFPPPEARIMTASPLWDWVEVSRWLLLTGKVERRAAEAAFRSAQISRAINTCARQNADVALVGSAIDAALAEPVGLCD
jgi:transcriptional regulator with XRE-family HTH domain